MTSTATEGPGALIEIRYAWPDRSWHAALTLYQPMSLGQVLTAAGFHQAHPGWDESAAGVGINGRVVSLDTPVRAGDRVEVYRPLSFDHMVSRRRRAQHKARQIKGRDKHE